MPDSFLCRATPLILIGALLGASASAAPRYKTNLPPPAELSYSITAKQKGIVLTGDALSRWSVAAGKFTATNEARAMLVGKIIDARTEGTIDAWGLAPARFTEKRLRREQTVTSFDRATKTIRFSASENTYPIQGGEQDRNSVIWQLVAVARAAPAKIKPDSSWTFFVAGQRDADQWTFKVVGREKLDTPLGQLDAVHIERLPMPDAKEKQLDIWLAPSLEWYPARLRFDDDNGDYIEQTLQRLNKKAS